MEYTKQEQYAIEEVVRKLHESVLLQEKKMGYIYWYHPEVKE
jgi:hypothetical protein